MLGLLKKEFYYCKWYLLGFFFLYVFVATIIVVTNILPAIVSEYESIEEIAYSFFISETVLIYVLASIPVAVISTSFAFDERSNFDKFILTSGVKRDTVITSKYLFTLLTSIVPLIIMLIVSIICFTNETINLVWSPLYLVSILISYVTIATFITTVNIYVMSRFGQMKQAAISSIFYIVFIFVIGVYLYLVMIGVVEAYDDIYDRALQSILTSSIGGAILIGLSAIFIYLTYQGYRKKEF